MDKNDYNNGKLIAEEPNYEQKQWVINKMKNPSWEWQRFCGSADKQKQSMDLDDPIEREGDS